MTRLIVKEYNNEEVKIIFGVKERKDKENTAYTYMIFFSEIK